MRRILSLAALGAVVASSPTAAWAEDIALSLNAGTTGLGAGLVYNLSEQLNVRGSYNWFEYNHEEQIDELEYDLDLELSTTELLLDWHPFNSGFRVTGGVVHNGTDLTGDARPTSTGTVEIGDRIFNAQEIGSVDADVDFNRIAPYLGIGYGKPFLAALLSQRRPRGDLSGQPGCDDPRAPRLWRRPGYAGTARAGSRSGRA